jgi:hypothetical protein
LVLPPFHIIGRFQEGKFILELLTKGRVRPRTFVWASLVLELSLFASVKSLTHTPSTNESTPSVYSVSRVFKLKCPNTGERGRGAPRRSEDGVHRGGEREVWRKRE